MNGHTGHGILVGHKKKWFQFSKPRLTIQPRAVACMRIFQKYFLFRATLTKSVLQIHFLKSWSCNKSTSGHRESPDVGNFEADSDGGQVEELTLLTACYFQWQGGLRVRAGRSEWEDVNCILYLSKLTCKKGRAPPADFLSGPRAQGTHHRGNLLTQQSTYVVKTLH